MNQHSPTVTAEIADVVASLRAEVAQLHAELPRWGLVVWTAGNVSARVPGRDLLVIKPSGVSYDELSPEAMVITDLEGNLVDGDGSRPPTRPHMPMSTSTCPRSAVWSTRTRRTPPPGLRAENPFPAF